MPIQKLSDRSLHRLSVFLFLVIAVLIVAGSIVFYNYESDRIHQEKYNDLAAIAALKAGQITSWRQERLTDAGRLAGNPFFIQSFSQWLADPGENELKTRLEDLLKVDLTPVYWTVLVYDRQENLLLAAQEENDPLSPVTAAAMKMAAATGEAVLSDFYMCSQGVVHIDAVAPVYGPDGALLGLVVMRSDADSLLYPLIQSWPTSSRSAETLLIERDGEEVLFLNELRHQSGTALTLREPLSNTSLPAVQAVLGYTGRFQGIDYRGEEVLAYVGPIQDTSWFMVAKIDCSEIFGELNFRAGAIAGLVFLLLLFIVSLAFVFARQRRLRQVQQLYQAESAARAALEEFRITLYSIGDGVITTDTAGLVKQVNPVAEYLTGWLEHQASGKPLEEVFDIVNENTGEKVENPVSRVLREGVVVGLANHTQLISKKGNLRPIADSGAPVRNHHGDITGVVLVFRDQTEERMAQKQLEAANRLYAFLSDINQAVVHIKNKQDLFDAICRIAVDAGQFAMAWVGEVDEKASMVKPVACSGRVEDFFDEVVIDLEREGHNTTNTARAILDGTIVICDDVKNSEGQVIHREALLQRGFRSFAAIPLKLNDRAVGNFTLYSDNPGFFSEQERKLLEEIAADINYALNSLEIEKAHHVAEKALQESEERFRTMVNSMEEIVFTLDSSMRHTGVYGPWVKRAGLTPEYFLGKTARDIFGEEAARVHEQANLKTLGGEFVIYDWETTGNDGTKYYQTSLSPIRNEQGAVIGLVGIGRDMTQRKEMEQALRESERHFRDLVENAPDAIFIQSQGRFAFLNRSALELFGARNPDELIGKPVLERFHPDYREKVKERITLLNEEKKPVSTIEEIYLKLDGSEVAVEVSAVPFFYHGYNGALVFARNITAKKAVEREARIMRDKAEVSSRLASVGEMAAGIAHEINNPLTGVIGFSELLAREELPEETRDYVRYILEGSNRVKEIVRRLLTFARQTTPYKTRLDVHELIDNTLELRGYVLRTANIEVSKDYESGLPWVSADPGQMQQVFLNLIVNAEYAMKKAHDGGTLAIATRHDGSHVFISFADSGPGMDPETLSRLFQPFFTTKEPGEGTGLGLALSRSIVLDHGGDILVESRPGAGTTFTVRLPVSRDGAEPGEAAGQARSVTRPSPASSRILVVDDEAPIRALVAKILTAQGHRVTEVGNPAQAIDCMAREAYDVILMDIRMPGMSGRELYARLDRAGPGIAGRVVVITGDTSDAGTRAFLREHNLPFIAKPFGREQLLEKVNEVLGRPQNPGMHNSEQ